jgi:hypothetical protein
VAILFDKLSSCESAPLSSNLENVRFQNFSRYYQGDYTLTFYNALSGIVDVKNKNYTNFLMTRNTKISNILEKENQTLKSESLLTNLNFGGNFLAFQKVDARKLGLLGIYNYNESEYYGNYNFTTNGDALSTNFMINLKSNNICDIYQYYDYKKYYLTRIKNDELSFCTKNLGLTAFDFNYIYSRPNKAIFLFQTLSGVAHFVKKTGNLLTLSPFTSANKASVYANPIYLSRDIYSDFNINSNTSYVEYGSDNIISENGILKDLENNYLLHRENDSTDIIVLKNQLLQDNTFTSGNTLLSSQDLKFFVDGMRNYTSIFNDIDAEKDETLALNYVFYNKSYEILPGLNRFTAPDNMSPFDRININDTKFVESGAFGYPTPEYADKVYRSDVSESYDDGQIYLCTWLSGSPLGSDKVWVDRYYYPDLIEKSLALAGDNTFNLTYENAVEKLVAENASIQESLSSFKVFDKKSDMLFVPNGKYTYERLQLKATTDEPAVITPCQSLTTTGNNINYFKQLNDAGKFTVKFYFEGDEQDWKFKSKRNNTDGGLTIEKRGDNLMFEMNLYNPGFVEIFTFKQTVKYKPFQRNFICFSIDVITGQLYFFLNTQIVSYYTFDKNQFFGKRLVFGDFVLNDMDIFTQKILSDIRITTEYTSENLAFITPILDGESVIDPITVTLPCGMRNSTDTVEYLQSVCNNQAYKSNFVNIFIKNVELEDSDMEGLRTRITSEIVDRSPLTTEINNPTIP